ncbi:hypothetical protein ECARS42123_1203, partial [Escherichia coli ARS4.2123]
MLVSIHNYIYLGIH